MIFNARVNNHFTKTLPSAVILFITTRKLQEDKTKPHNETMKLSANQTAQESIPSSFTWGQTLHNLSYSYTSPCVNATLQNSSVLCTVWYHIIA